MKSNKRRNAIISWTLFSLGTLIILSFGLLIFLEDFQLEIFSHDTKNYISAPNTSIKELNCKSVVSQKIHATLVPWVNTGYYTAFDTEKNQLSLYSWTLEQNKLISTLNSQTALTCEKPSYHCFPQNTHLRLIYFSPPYGLIEAEAGSVKNVFSFSWNSQQDFRLGEPLADCQGEAFDFSDSDIFQSRSSLLIHHQKTNQISEFNIGSLSGASLKSARRGPSKIFQILPDGSIEASTCSEFSKKALPEKAQLEPFQLLQSQSIFMAFRPSNAGQLNLFHQDFQPLQKTQYPVNFVTESSDQPFKKFYISDKSIIEISMDTSSQPRIVEKKQNISELNLFEILKLNNVSVDLKNTRNVFDLSAHRWLSWVNSDWFRREKFYLYDFNLNQALEIKSPFEFHGFKPVKYVHIGFLSPSTFFRFRSDGSSTSFDAYSCQEEPQ